MIAVLEFERSAAVGGADFRVAAKHILTVSHAFF
jgi:hypothetical protein